MRKLLRELRRAFPGTEIKTTCGNHYAIKLPNGRTVIVSNTPSRSSVLKSAKADVRRQMRHPQNKSPLFGIREGDQS
jgi:hypothetical protein